MLIKTLKLPLIIAAFVVVMRVVVERAGAPHIVGSLISIAALITVIAPVYFALEISKNKTPRPYLMLLQLVFIYAVCARAMVLPTYWLARIYHWPEARFAGVDAPNPFIGFVALPLLTAAFWIVAAMVVGGAVGAVTLKVAKRNS